VCGYEIHMGHSSGPALRSPAVELGDRVDGVLAADGRILGTYLHGLFDAQEACAALLAWAGLDGANGVDYAALREQSIDRLADAVSLHVDVERLLRLAGGARPAVA